MLRRFASLGLLCVSVLILAGCAGALRSGGWGFGLFLLGTLGLASLLQTQTACDPVGVSESHQDGKVTGDGGTQKDGVVSETQPEGTWEACCSNGKIDSCFCPAGAACNYGWFTDCGNGTCVPNPNQQCGEGTTEIVPEKMPEKQPEISVETQPEGTWEACCNNGKIESCFCPGGAACNYGWFTDCGNGTCVPNPNQQCGEGTTEIVPEKMPELKPDPQPELKPEPQPEGTWETCCKSGKIDSCFCPAGVACNYGWFTDCGNGTCSLDPTKCAEVLPERKPEPQPEPQPEGTWEACCQSGKISTCFCPAGLACNYGQFMSCGNGTCVGPAQSCP
ncbi:MAG: hypothetical protein H6727_00095 [Myxococcales bacterium]|nr:hypothetical protein [Myxococcales bacterium]